MRILRKARAVGLAVALAVARLPVRAWAHVGPGAGFAFVTSFFLLLTTLASAAVALLTCALPPAAATRAPADGRGAGSRPAGGDHRAGRDRPAHHRAPDASPHRLRRRTKDLREAISKMDYVAAGSLAARTKRCGRKTCPCATDPDARHGPYHVWSRYDDDGRHRHTTVTPEQAKLLAPAIENYREIRRLLKRWQRETVAETLNAPKPHPGNI